MSEQQLLAIAENAKFVVSGYAFTAMENYPSIIPISQATNAKMEKQSYTAQNHQR